MMTRSTPWYSSFTLIYRRRFVNLFLGVMAYRDGFKPYFLQLMVVLSARNGRLATSRLLGFAVNVVESAKLNSRSSRQSSPIAKAVFRESESIQRPFAAETVGHGIERSRYAA